ncbi:hypothetical protein PV325_010701 [Microctonus aethiopoides]|nr:hypothetical protein PV325_010701 [Microctonus aethiopoides]
MATKCINNIVAISFTISYLLSAQFFLIDSTKKIVNNRPIIGILAQEISHHMNNIYPGLYESYIAASYVKYLESSGARVVPIWIGENESYYEDILSKINGVLFPGGNADFNQTNGFAESGNKIFKIATRMNNNGDYFPIWGTCLGFELLTYLAADCVDFRCDCSAKNVALPLIFKSDFMKSRLFKNAPEDGLSKVNLANEYRVISLNNDINGLTFISSIEHYNLPIYATQFHPEKNNFEWAKRLSGIPHSNNAIKISQYFSNFFVNEARKNFHRFPSQNEEADSLIYNYPVTYTDCKPYQILKHKDGYIAVFIRHGDEPLVNIDPVLAEAFNEKIIEVM